MLYKIKRMLYYFIKKFFSIFLKIDSKKIVFDNFLGKGYGCNPKYIAQEMINQKIDCKMVWLVNDLEEDMPKEIKKVKYGSIKAFYELATAKVWVDNVRNFKMYKKKKQFYIQTWHAGYGLKKIEKETENTLSPEYVKQAKYDGKITNLMLSNSKQFSERIKNSFWYNGKILEKGFPRDDILYEVPKEIRKKVYDYFGIDYNKKIVLYAPTFRKNMDINIYLFEFEKCCEILKKKFNEDFVMLIRMHPNVAQCDEKICYNNVIINATHYPDIQELIAVSNIGITDYSSVLFDFSKINKPMFLLCKDYEQYTSNDRGLYIDIKELPISIAKDEDELIKNIEKFDEDIYLKKCEKFYTSEEIGAIRNDKASSDVVKIIKEQLSK